MTVYRFVYEFGSVRTESFVKANSEEEAIEKFRKTKGDKKIFNIECLEEDDFRRNYR